MKIQLRFFASLREALGAQHELELAEGSTVAELRERLLERGGRYTELLAPTRAVRCAVNQVMAGESTVIAEGAEVAFFPPVTGG